MAFLDRCIFLPVSAGLADFVVSAPVVGFQTPAQAGAVSGQTFHYVASYPDNTVWEIGLGTYTVLSGIATLSRTVISSSAGGAKVNFNVVPNVAVDAISADFNSLLASIATINKTIPAVVNAQAFGADPTGANDSSPALIAAFNALPNITALANAAGGEIYFPPGLYRFNSQVALTLPAGWGSVAIKGAGPAATVLWWPNASGGIVIDVSASGGVFGSAIVQGMKFITGQTGGGDAVKLVNTVANISSQQAPSVFRDLLFWGADSSTQYWTNAVNVANVCNVNFENVVINGALTIAGTGVSLAGSTAHSGLAVIYNFVNCSFTTLSAGILYGPWCQGVSIANCNFTTNNIGIWAPSSEAGGIGQLLISSSQFGTNSVGAFAIKIETPIEGVALNANLFIIAGTSDVGVQATAYARMQIVGNEFIAPAGGIGIAIGGTVLDASASAIVSDNTFFNFTSGLTVAAGAKAVVIHDNSFRACVTAITNASTDTVNRIHDNIGYNPVGASAVASPPASGGTYTAGPSPETIYMSAGTSISNITQGGTSILPAAIGANVPFTVQLECNESFVPTYTGTLTMKKMVH